MLGRQIRVKPPENLYEPLARTLPQLLVEFLSAEPFGGEGTRFFNGYPHPVGRVGRFLQNPGALYRIDQQGQRQFQRCLGHLPEPLKNQFFEFADARFRKALLTAAFFEL